MHQEELGFFGNVWVRSNHLEKAGDFVKGHKHKYDHVSLLAKGKVQVQIGDLEPQVFNAPIFIVIRKEYVHKITALEDDTIWYCVFAMRRIDGEVVDMDEMEIYNKANDPMPGRNVSLDYWKNIKKLQNISIENNDELKTNIATLPA
jgi:hypothetical protein